MAVAGEIKVLMTMDSSDFTIKTVRAGQVVSDLKAKIRDTGTAMQQGERHFQSFGRSMHGFLITAAAVKYLMLDLNQVFLSFPMAVLKTSGEIERLTQLMTGLSTASTAVGRMEEAQRGLKYVFDLAQRAPFEIKALTDAFVKFKSAGIDPMNGSMNAMVDSVAKFGGTSETLHRASIAIQQMAGKGVISMEELRQQLGEAVPTAMAQMARGMGLSMAELAAKVKTGTVEASSALNKMFAQMELENGGAAYKMSQTWVGMIEQLKTKWELFKLAVGKEGLFDTAKEELQKLLAAFTGDSAANWAQFLGKLLKSLVDGLIAAIKFTREWWTEIKNLTIGLATLWAVMKASTIIEALIGRVRGVITVFQAAQTAQRELVTTQLEQQRQAALAQAQLATNQIAANEKALAAKRAALAAEDVLRQQNVAKEIAANEKILASKLAMLEKQKAAAILAANQAYMAEMAIPTRNAKGQFVSAADKAPAVAEAARLAQNAEMQRQAALALEKEAQLIRNRNVALAASTTATNTMSAAVRAETAVMTANNTALALSAAEHQKAAAAVGSLTTATGLAAGAKAALRAVLGTLINPITITIGAIMGLVWAWEKVTGAANAAMERQKAAAEFLEGAKRGVATKEGLQTTRDTYAQVTTEIAELQKQRAQLEAIIADPSAAAGYGGADAVARDLAKTIERITSAEQAAKNALQGMVLGAKIVLTQEADGLMRVLDDKYSQGVANATDKFNAQLEANAKKFEALRAGLDAKKDAAKLAALDKQEREAIKKLDMEGIAELESLAKQNVAALEARLKANVDEAGNRLGEAERTAIEKQLNKLRGERMERYKTMRAQLEAPNVFNASKDGAGKGSKIAPDDPLNDLLAQAQAQMIESQAKINGIKDGARDVTDRYAEAYEMLRGKLRSGAFDITTYNDDGKKVVDKSRRSLADKPLDEFLDAATGDLKKFGDVIRALAGDKANEAAFTAVSKSIDMAASSAVEFDIALERLTSGNAEKQTSGMRSMQRQFATLELQARGSAEALDLLARKKEEALGNQASADLANFAADQRLGAERAYLDVITNRSERIEAAYQFEERRLRDMWQLRRQAVIDHVKDNELKNRLLAESDAAYYAAAESRAALHFEAMKTPLQRLVDTWADATANMEDATAQWAQSSLDEFMNFTKTGEFNFKKLTESILSDILRIMLQAQLAKAIGPIAGNIGSAIAGFLGLGGGTSAAVPGTGGFVPGPQFGTFAMGGIMGPDGIMPLHKYARGGIADSPQLAMFGEGSMREAYVPLPDGRSIPVTLAGGANVTVNVINQTGQQVTAEQSAPRFDGRQMILDVVLTAAGQPGPFRDNLKGALR